MKNTLLTTIAIIAIAGSARSELVLDNISNGDDSTRTFIGDTNWAAQSFETSAGSWTLDSVDVRVSGYTSNFFVALYADSGSNLPAAAPGGVLETLSGQSSFSSYTITNQSYTSTGTTLAGNTRYWIVAGAGSGAEMDWTRAADATSTGSWSIPGINPTALSSTDGATWTVGSGIQNFSINASAAAAAVPEPGQVAASLLLLAGTGGYVWMKRRKTAKPAAPAV